MASLILELARRRRRREQERDSLHALTHELTHELNTTARSRTHARTRSQVPAGHHELDEPGIDVYMSGWDVKTLAVGSL